MCAALELSAIESNFRSVHDFPGTIIIDAPVLCDPSTQDKVVLWGSHCTILDSVHCMTVRGTFEISRI